MSLDLDELGFCGLAESLAEEYGASFAEEPAELPIRKSLYQEYLKSGTKSNGRQWLKRRIEELFVSLSEPPAWIERKPEWPFLNGEPMTFIGQLPVDANDVSSVRLFPDTVVFIFGARVYVKEFDGWEMQYRVRTQHRSLS